MRETSVSKVQFDQLHRIDSGYTYHLVFHAKMQAINAGNQRKKRSSSMISSEYDACFYAVAVRAFGIFRSAAKS